MTSITMDELAERFQNWHLSDPKANLCDLPPEIIEIVIQNTNIVSRIALRKVSRTLRELVDKQDPFCDLIVLKINAKYVMMNLEGTFVNYKEKAEYNANHIQMKIIDDVLQDLLIFMSHPNFRLKHLKVKFTEIYSLKYFLGAWNKHFPFQFQVEKVTVIVDFVMDSDADEKYWKLIHEWMKMDSAQDAYVHFVEVDKSTREEWQQVNHWFRNDHPSLPLGEWMV